MRMWFSNLKSKNVSTTYAKAVIKIHLKRVFKLCPKSNKRCPLHAILDIFIFLGLISACNFQQRRKINCWFLVRGVLECSGSWHRLKEHTVCFHVLSLKKNYSTKCCALQQYNLGQASLFFHTRSSLAAWAEHTACAQASRAASLPKGRSCPSLGWLRWVISVQHCPLPRHCMQTWMCLKILKDGIEGFRLFDVFWLEAKKARGFLLLCAHYKVQTWQSICVIKKKWILYITEYKILSTKISSYVYI